MKRIFDITFNGEESFETEAMTMTDAINMCWDTLVQNDMKNDSYMIGYFDNDEYVLVANVSRRRRRNGRVSCLIYKYNQK